MRRRIILNDLLIRFLTKKKHKTSVNNVNEDSQAFPVIDLKHYLLVLRTKFRKVMLLLNLCC